MNRVCPAHFNKINVNGLFGVYSLSDSSHVLKTIVWNVHSREADRNTTNRMKYFQWSLFLSLSLSLDKNKGEEKKVIW